MGTGLPDPCIKKHVAVNYGGQGGERGYMYSTKLYLPEE